jgi:hypothetical protein
MKRLPFLEVPQLDKRASDLVLTGKPVSTRAEVGVSLEVLRPLIQPRR